MIGRLMLVLASVTGVAACLAFMAAARGAVAATGTWANAVALTYGTSSALPATATAISCAASACCAAGGTGFVASETSGAWGSPVPVSAGEG